MNKLFKKLFRPNLLLSIIFIIIIAYEIFVLYYHVYPSLSTEYTEIPNQNIVRLDLDAYSKTLQLLDSSVNFAPPIWNLINVDPFR